MYADSNLAALNESHLPLQNIYPDISADGIKESSKTCGESSHQPQAPDDEPDLDQLDIQGIKDFASVRTMMPYPSYELDVRRLHHCQNQLCILPYPQLAGDPQP